MLSPPGMQKLQPVGRALRVVPGPGALPSLHRYWVPAHHTSHEMRVSISASSITTLSSGHSGGFPNPTWRVPRNFARRLDGNGPDTLCRGTFSDGLIQRSKSAVATRRS